jgi:hypothetical protein
MTDAISLQPSSAEPSERALSLAYADLGRLPFGVLSTLWDPWTCPAAVLPALAWAWSVDYWRDWWPEDRKRQVVAESRAFHMAKGTIVADRMACGYADAELISYHLPRDGFTVGAVPSPAAYQAWVNGLPEIRVYPLPPRPAGAVKPLGGALGRDPVFGSDHLARARRAELRKGDQVLPLVVSGETFGPDGMALDEIERVSVPQPPRPTLRVGLGPLGSPLGGRPDTRRVFDFDWRPSSADPFDLKPGVPSLVPAEAAPRKVPIARAPRTWRVAVGRSALTGAVGAAPARANYYLALRVADGTGPSGDRPRGGVVGRDRLPRARYSKELSVLVARPMRRGWPLSGARLLPDPKPKMNDVLNSIASAQALRDEVSVDFNVINPLTVTDFDAVTETTRVGATRMITRR